MINRRHLNKIYSSKIYIPNDDFIEGDNDQKYLIVFVEEKQTGNVEKYRIPCNERGKRLRDIPEGKTFIIGNTYFYKSSENYSYIFKDFDSLQIYENPVKLPADMYAIINDYPQWKFTKYEDTDGEEKINHVLYETPGKILKINNRPQEVEWPYSFRSTDIMNSYFYLTINNEWFLYENQYFIPEYKNSFVAKSDIKVIGTPILRIKLVGKEFLEKSKLEHGKDYLEVVTFKNSLINVHNPDIQAAVTSNSFTTLEQLQECNENILCGMKYYLEIEKRNM